MERRRGAVDAVRRFASRAHFGAAKLATEFRDLGKSGHCFFLTP